MRSGRTDSDGHAPPGPVAFHPGKARLGHRVRRRGHDPHPVHRGGLRAASFRARPGVPGIARGGQGGGGPRLHFDGHAVKVALPAHRTGAELGGGRRRERPAPRREAHRPGHRPSSARRICHRHGGDAGVSGRAGGAAARGRGRRLRRPQDRGRRTARSGLGHSAVLPQRVVAVPRGGGDRSVHRALLGPDHGQRYDRAPPRYGPGGPNDGPRRVRHRCGRSVPGRGGPARCRLQPDVRRA